jgi:hypothetical protein
MSNATNLWSTDAISIFPLAYPVLPRTSDRRMSVGVEHRQRCGKWMDLPRRDFNADIAMVPGTLERSR